MAKRQIQTDNIGAPSGHFSQATAVAAKGTLVFISGMTSRRPDGSIAGIGDIEAQTRQTLSNVEAVLREGGASWDDVLKCNVYLKDMNDFQRMNEIFSEIFPDRPPARTTVQTPMAEETMLVEIEAVAYIGD